MTSTYPDGRTRKVTEATRVWTGQLVDLTARNNLLYYRDLKLGTLDLVAARADGLHALLAGQQVVVSTLFPNEGDARDATRRARALRSRGEEHLEERGLQTLYLACGMATWTNHKTGAPPCAPVLLCPVQLIPKGRLQEDFEIVGSGDLEVNQTLIHFLETEFRCSVDSDELLNSAGIEGAIDTPEELDITYRWLARKCIDIPGFVITPRFVVGTFSYAKLPMVQDLRNAHAAILEHDLISALAGDPSAQDSVRARHAQVGLSAPDYTPPADEFLVLDADASQNHAINSVVAGQDLIIKGPPGNGKSQTITNLIATLMARGKSVLFVAEKRAAIDAVLRNLNKTGLDDLILDLHGKATSRREVAQQLGAALDAVGRVARIDHSAEHRMLEVRRQELMAHVSALRRVWAPWGVSYFDVQSRLLAASGAVSNVRFRGPVLDALCGDHYRSARDELRDYAGAGGVGLAGADSPWAGAQVTSHAEAQRVRELLDVVVRAVPATLAALRRAAEATGLRPAHNMGSWPALFTAWGAASGTLSSFRPDIYDVAVDELLDQLTPLRKGLVSRAVARMTSPSYRCAYAKVMQTVTAEVAVAPKVLYSQLESVRSQKRQWEQMRARAQEPGAPGDVAVLQESYAHIVNAADELGRLVPHLAALTDDALVERARMLLADHRGLAQLPELHRLRQALHSRGLQDLIDDMQSQMVAPELVERYLDQVWLRSLAEHIEFSDSKISTFNGDFHSVAVTEYQALDRQHLAQAAHRVRRIVAERTTSAQDEFPSQATVVRAQAARKRKHLAVRSLFAQAPDVLTAIKPCWAMSPLEVSQLLPSDRQYFDVVIFDEASQVTPADAIPAILRGKRLVVSGDERQLPPTSFFAGGDSQTDFSEDDGVVAVDEGYESILEALMPFIAYRMLTWHYRSQDERLIAFANTYTYDRSLTTFPGTVSDDCIKHVLVPFSPSHTGSEVSAGAEVNEVVRLILEHAEQRPEESLGVIAMGVKHADRIKDALRRARLNRPEFDDFFSENRQEACFVKNLERVQGDERDAIILTVGYGKNADGRLLYRFGPLLEEGGQRRLNVAVTRAKRRMTVVSSFSHHDMDPDKCKNGVHHLRLYLQYAASKGTNLGSESLSIPELNPFEIDVRDALTQAGMSLIPQFGCSGYRIDFAARHPEQPGRMVLAIECDGASYHSSPTARDRDRLRQEHLERLGWTFHRIWSQDWFSHRDAEVTKVLESYQAALSRQTDTAPPTPTIDEAAQPTLDQTLVVGASSEPANVTPGASPADMLDSSDEAISVIEAPARMPRPAVSPGRKIHEYRQDELRAMVRWIMSDTLLRTNDQLLKETMEALGFARRGSKIVETISNAIAAEKEALRTLRETTGMW